MSKYKWNKDYKKLMDNKRIISSKQAAAVLTGAVLILTPYSLQATGTTIHNPTQNIVAAESDKATVGTDIEVETDLETTVDLIGNNEEDEGAVIETDTGVESSVDVEVDTDTGLDANVDLEVDADAEAGAQVDPDTGDPAEVDPNPGDSADVEPNPGDSADVEQDVESGVEVEVDTDTDLDANVDLEVDADAEAVAEVDPDIGDPAEVDPNPGDSAEVEPNPGDSADVEQDVESDGNVDVDQEVEVDLDTIVTARGNLVANFLEAEQALQLMYTISYDTTINLRDSYYVITLSNELAANIKSVSYVGLHGTQAVAVEGNTITIPAAQVINESVNLELLIEYVTAPTTGNFNVSIGQYLSGSETSLVNSGSSLTVTVPEAETDIDVDAGVDLDTGAGTRDDSSADEDEGAGINGELDTNEDIADYSALTEEEEDQVLLVNTGHEKNLDDSAGHLLPVTANNWWNMALAGVAALAAGIVAKLYRFRRQFS